MSSTYCLLPTAYLTYYFAGPDLPAPEHRTEASCPGAVVLPGGGGGGLTRMGAEAENKFSTLLGSLIIARAKLEIMELFGTF